MSTDKITQNNNHNVFHGIKEKVKTCSEWVGRSTTTLKIHALEKISELIDCLRKKLFYQNPQFWSGVPDGSISDHMPLPYKEMTRGILSFSANELGNQFDKEGGDITFKATFQGKELARLVEPASRKQYDLYLLNIPLNQSIKIKAIQAATTWELCSFNPEHPSFGNYVLKNGSIESNKMNCKTWRPDIIGCNAWGTGSPDPLQPISVEVLENCNMRIAARQEMLDPKKMLKVVNEADKLRVLTLTLSNYNHDLRVAFPVVVHPGETKYYSGEQYKKTWKNSHEIAGTKGEIPPPNSIHWVHQLEVY